MSDSDRGYGYEPDEEDDYYTYDATDDDDDGRRRPIVILAIIALLVVFTGVVFLAYKQGLKQGAQGNPPVIRADDSPIKVAPANPGGMKFPHQDKTVYDRISGADAGGASDAEHLLPSAEEPIAVQPKVAEAAPVPGAEAAPAQPEAVPPVAAAPAAPVQQAPAVSPAPAAPVAALPAAQAPAAPAQAAPAATATAAGGYVVQLAAFRDEPTARAEFEKLKKKHSALAGLQADIQRADLGAKGIYYRLRAGYMDKAKAGELCGTLKAQGQACLVKPR